VFVCVCVCVCVADGWRECCTLACSAIAAEGPPAARTGRAAPAEGVRLGLDELRGGAYG